MLVRALSDCFPKDIQLLIHPMWWVYEDPNTEAVWNEVFKSNFEQTQAQLLLTERAFGPKRKLEIESVPKEDNSDNNG